MATSAMISSIAMAFSVTFTFLVAVLVIFLYVHSHYYGIERFSTRRRREARRNHFIFEAGDPSNSSIGLNPSILFSLPISVYRSSDFKEGLECAVCLSELADGEKARLLPNCSHGFHLECIDMWLRSHSTCPLCRCPVGGEDDGLHRSESASLDIERSDLNGGRMLAISIPDRSTEIFQSSLPPISPIGSQLGERKSPVEDSGSPARLNVGSLKRILSGGKMIGGSCCSSAVVGDIEQGLAGYEEGS